ncbi:MAG: BamA/TamA family outer membrane protein [Acidobacteria bacterium]|nr:BamA/TamA family outer membrane protein [Acidobacteriota bacterium]
MLLCCVVGGPVWAQTGSAASAMGQPAQSAGPDASMIANVLPALPETEWSLEGTKVTAVRFEGVTFGEKEAIIAELKQKAGEPLDPSKVRGDLRTLFATGRYRNISVYAEKAEGGVDLVYAGEPRYFVGRVTIAGVKQERLASLLEFATRMNPGEAYSADALPTAVEAVKEALAENGFYVPKVALSTAVDTLGHQVNATFTIATGPQAVIGTVALGGTDPGMDAAMFRKKGKMDCSWLSEEFDKAIHRDCVEKVTRETTSNALSGVRSYYEKLNHLEGTISLQQSTYMQPKEQVDYDFSANQGPEVKVIVDGTKLSKSRTKLLVPVYQEGAVDNDLLNEGAFNIKDYMQQKGYFDVKDKVELIGKGTNNVVVQYTVDTGRRHKVTAVNIVGNKYFDRSTLEDLMKVKKADLYQSSGRYSAELVTDDVNAIESLYRANGFSDVKVTAKVQDMDDAANGKPLKEPHIRVLYTVVEGPQQKFGTVALTGVAADREKAIRALMNSAPGQPFSLITLSSDRDAILNNYLAHGFEHARVEITQKVDSKDKLRTDVALNVMEGQQVFIDHVLLSGIVHTRPKVVDSQILVHAGDPLDQAALLQTQRNLYNLALFSEVNAAVQDPKGDAPDKNVLLQLTEARRWDVTYGFGFEAQTGTPGITTGQTRGSTAAQNGQAGVSPDVSVDISRINLRGTQDSLTLHTTYGLLEEVATLSLNIPQLFSRKNLTGTIGGGYSNVQDITTFASSTLQGDVRVTQKVKRADTFIYDFQYRRVSVNPNSLEITPNLIPQLSEPVVVGGPQVTYFHDTRDPSPLNAGKGMYFSAQEFVASSKFGSQSNFNKLDTSYSTYYTFGRRKYVFARNTRIAFEKSWGPNPNAYNAGDQIGVASTACSGTLLETNPTCDPVPLPERLYVGGESSDRGFGINDGGPRDLTTGFPVGGSAAVVNQLELRFPPATLPYVGSNLSFVLFHDMGNAFEYPSKMFTSIVHFNQPHASTCKNLSGPLIAAGEQPSNAIGTCDFNYYSHAIGLGLRYATPVGPIRVDFSYNLDPTIYPVFDDYTGVLPYVGLASHFNFFFSIGQSF